MANREKLLIKQKNILQFTDWTVFQMSVTSLGSGVEDRTWDFAEHCSKCSYLKKQHDKQYESHRTNTHRLLYNKKQNTFWQRLQSPARHVVQQPSKYCQVA